VDHQNIKRCRMVPEGFQYVLLDILIVTVQFVSVLWNFSGITYCCSIHLVIIYLHTCTSDIKTIFLENAVNHCNTKGWHSCTPIFGLGQSKSQVRLKFAAGQRTIMVRNCILRSILLEYQHVCKITKIY